MNKTLILLTFLFMTITSSAQSADIYDYSFIDINGKEVQLSQFRGKKILFVNVASKCVYTPQYDQLQGLHEKYKEQLVIIGFPSNQFLKQEKGSNSEINSFCKKNYGVEFIMASKIDVKGKNQHPIYQWLTRKELNKVKKSKVKWNFNKYLVDEKGKLLARFKSKIKPTDEKLVNMIIN